MGNGNSSEDDDDDAWKPVDLPTNTGDSDFVCNILLIGDKGTGKSSTLQTFFGTKNPISPTIGFELKKKIVEIDNVTVKYQVWDLSGDHDYLWLSKKELNNFDAVFLFYDCTDKSTFDNLITKFNDSIINNFSKDVICRLVSNKNDLGDKKFTDEENIIDKFISEKNYVEDEEILIKILAEIPKVADDEVPVKSSNFILDPNTWKLYKISSLLDGVHGDFDIIIKQMFEDVARRKYRKILATVQAEKNVAKLADVNKKNAKTSNKSPETIKATPILDKPADSANLSNEPKPNKLNNNSCLQQ